MDADKSTASAPEERGAGGKFRKPPPRKPAASPYARPPGTVRSRWISKLVDPAYRFIAGGATRILPSFFSTAPFTGPTSATEDQDKWQTVDSHEDDLYRTGDGKEDDLRQNDKHLLASKLTEMAGTGDISGKLNSSSDLVLSRQDEKGEQSNKNKLSDIEQLVKRKNFSRDEFDRLVEVLNSRAMDLSNVEQGKENTNLTSGKDDQGLAMAHGFPKVLDERRHGESTGAIWGSSTPLALSKVRDEIGASPIEIARAYMDSRASSVGPSSKSTIHTVESTMLHGDEAGMKYIDPSPSKKSSICWPGAVLPDTYVTQQSQSSRYGLHNFPRTPYSRSLLKKPKSKLIHRQGDNSHISSTPLQSQTTPYLQDKPEVSASESGYGSVGPIRRIRHKVGTQSSSRRPAFSSLNGHSQRESSGVIERFTPIAKSMDPGGTSCTHKPLGFEVGVPTVPTHTSLMAKKILDHIDRNIPTPKEKSAELKLATKWKNPESSADFNTILSNEDNGLLRLKDVSPYKYGGLDGKKSTLRNEDRGNYHVDMQPRASTDKSIDVRQEGTLASDLNAYSSNPRLANQGSTMQNFGGYEKFSTSSEEDALKTLPSGSHPCVLNQEKKPLNNPAASKPVLPPISIKKPESRWALASDNGSGFTFPVSASSSVFSEPPTPSIMPLLSSGEQNQLKERSTELSYSFGFKKSTPALVFSFPSTSNTVQNDTGDVKFNFGSTEKPRLSFSFGKNAVCC